jgi:hypothetical protein
VAGIALAWASLWLGFPTGWIGGAAIIGWALAARRRWAALEENSGLEPGAPERIVWLRLAGVAIIAGHMAASIPAVGDSLRLGNGNSLAIDAWTILLAHMIASLLFRRDSSEKDERHDAISAHGVRAGYAACLILLIALLGWLAYAPPNLRSFLTHFVLANALVELILASYAVMLLVQLIDYAKDTRRAFASP